MKHLFYLPAFLALTTVSAYAQDAGVDTNTDVDANAEYQAESDLGASTDAEAGAELGASTDAHGADMHDFTSADKDGNGELSIEEAQEALPDLVIVDINNDGVLNRSEAENAMPGLNFDESGVDAAADAPDPAISEQDYLAIVTQMEQQNQDQAGISASQQSDSDLSSTESRDLSSTESGLDEDA